MLKDTKSLGNNKAPACESRGFVHKKKKMCILTHLLFTFNNIGIQKKRTQNSVPTSVTNIASFLSLSGRTHKTKRNERNKTNFHSSVLDKERKNK